MGAIIVNNLSQEIRDSKYFSIMSDEAADISNKENLSVVIRFLDSTKTVREGSTRRQLVRIRRASSARKVGPGFMLIVCLPNRMKTLPTTRDSMSLNVHSQLFHHVFA